MRFEQDEDFQGEDYWLVPLETVGLGNTFYLMHLLPYGGELIECQVRDIGSHDVSFYTNDEDEVVKSMGVDTRVLIERVK